MIAYTTPRADEAGAGEDLEAVAPDCLFAGSGNRADDALR